MAFKHDLLHCGSMSGHAEGGSGETRDQKEPGDKAQTMAADGERKGMKIG